MTPQLINILINVSTDRVGKEFCLRLYVEKNETKLLIAVAGWNVLLQFRDSPKMALN